MSKKIYTAEDYHNAMGLAGLVCGALGLILGWLIFSPTEWEKKTTIYYKHMYEFSEKEDFHCTRSFENGVGLILSCEKETR